MGFIIALSFVTSFASWKTVLRRDSLHRVDAKAEFYLPKQSSLGVEKTICLFLFLMILRFLNCFRMVILLLELWPYYSQAAGESGSTT